MADTGTFEPVRSRAEWAVLDVLRAHLYDDRNRGSKPTDPGWHVCSCGWEGYWCDWQPHVARQVLDAGLIFPPEPNYCAEAEDPHVDPCSYCPHDNTEHAEDGCRLCGCAVPQ